MVSKSDVAIVGGVDALALAVSGLAATNGEPLVAGAIVVATAASNIFVFKWLRRGGTIEKVKP